MILLVYNHKTLGNLKRIYITITECISLFVLEAHSTSDLKTLLTTEKLPESLPVKTTSFKIRTISPLFWRFLNPAHRVKVGGRRLQRRQRIR